MSYPRYPLELDHSLPGGSALDVSPQGLAGLARRFDVQGSELVEVLRDAARRLDAIGDFWGHDSAGRKFYEAEGGRGGYGNTSADIAHEVRALAITYAGIGDHLVIMGRNVAAADWASIPSLPGVPA